MTAPKLAWFDQDVYDGRYDTPSYNSSGELYGLMTRKKLGIVCFGYYYWSGGPYPNPYIYNFSMIAFDHSGALKKGTEFVQDGGMFSSAPTGYHNVQQLSSEAQMAFVSDDIFVVMWAATDPSNTYHSQVGELSSYRINTDLSIVKLDSHTYTSLGLTSIDSRNVTVDGSANSTYFFLRYIVPANNACKVMICHVDEVTGSITFGAEHTSMQMTNMWQTLPEVYPNTYIAWNSSATHGAWAFKIDGPSDTYTEGPLNDGSAYVYGEGSWQWYTVSTKIPMTSPGEALYPSWNTTPSLSRVQVNQTTLALTITPDYYMFPYPPISATSPYGSPQWYNNTPSGGIGTDGAGNLMVMYEFYDANRYDEGWLFYGKMPSPTSLDLGSMLWPMLASTNIGYSASSGSKGFVILAGDTSGTPNNGTATAAYPYGHIFLAKIGGGEIPPLRLINRDDNLGKRPSPRIITTNTRGRPTSLQEGVKRVGVRNTWW